MVATGSASGTLQVNANVTTTQSVTTNVQGVAQTQAIQVTNNIRSLQSIVMDSGATRTLGTATSTDNGSVPGILSWERWTNGTVTTQSGGTITIPNANSGLAVIDGQLATNLPSFVSGSTPSPGTAVQYSLVGGTSPTVANGSVAPGTLLNSGTTVSQIGVDFLDQKIGLNLYVGIGGGIYDIQTNGGASNPSSSSILLNGALFNSTGPTAPLGKHPLQFWPAVPSPARKPVTLARQDPAVRAILGDAVCTATLTGTTEHRHQLFVRQQR